MSDPEARQRSAIELARNALAGRRFGASAIAVHDGEIVQIARTENIRPVRADR